MALPLYPFSIYFTDGISQVDRGLQRPRPSCGRSGSGEGFGLENFKERFGKMLHLLTLLLIASSAPQSLMRKSMPFSSYWSAPGLSSSLKNVNVLAAWGSWRRLACPQAGAKRVDAGILSGIWRTAEAGGDARRMQGGFDGNLFVCSPGSPVILHSSALACLFPSLLLLLALMIRPVN